MKYFTEACIFFLQTFFAEGLLIWALYSGYAILSLFTSSKEKQPVALRFCSIAVASGWWITAVFHILLALHAFLWPYVVLFAVFSGLITHFTVLRFSKFLRLLSHDILLLGKWICRSVKGNPLIVILFALHLFLMLKALLYFAGGWDALVYHLTKAAFWVQDGAPMTLKIPGIWDAYMHFFGGGEIFIAWAMLPFHGDFVVGLMDVLLWEFLGFGVYALARELEIRGSYAWIAPWFVWFIPGLFRWLGSSYIDIGMHAFLVAALALIVHFFKKNQLREMALTGMAAGVAAGFKITSLPLAAILFGFILISGVWKSQDRRIFLRHFFLAGLLAAAVCVPWMIYNTLDTGYPLSPFPIKVGDIMLGKGAHSIHIGMIVPNGTPYNWADELRFGFYPLLRACDGAIGFLPMALFPLGLLGLFFRKPLVACLFAAAIFCQISFYWGPSFSAARLGNSTQNARFLFLIVALSAVLLFYVAPRWKKLFAACLCLVSARTLFVLLRGWGEKNLWILLLAFILLALVYGAAWIPFRSPNKAFIILCIVLPLFLLPFYFFSQNHHYDYLIRRRSFRKDAIAARTVDDPKNPHRIALAVASDGRCLQFFYPFMGRHLQNRLFYIPVTESGVVIQNGNYEKEKLNFSVWWERLKQNHISHVACFASPTPSVELGWMRRRRGTFFRKLIGKTRGPTHGRWGVFAVQDQPNESN